MPRASPPASILPQRGPRGATGTSGRVLRGRVELSGPLLLSPAPSAGGHLGELAQAWPWGRPARMCRSFCLLQGRLGSPLLPPRPQGCEGRAGFLQAVASRSLLQLPHGRRLKRWSPLLGPVWIHPPDPIRL